MVCVASNIPVCHKNQIPYGHVVMNCMVHFQSLIN